MCTSLAGCEDGGECYSCRKLGESVDWEPYVSKSFATQKDKTEFDIWFFETFITKNEIRKENKDGNAIRSTEPAKEPINVQRDTNIKRQENVPVEGYCVWGQWRGENHSPINRKKSNNY